MGGADETDDQDTSTASSNEETSPANRRLEGAEALGQALNVFLANSSEYTKFASDLSATVLPGIIAAQSAQLWIGAQLAGVSKAVSSSYLTNLSAILRNTVLSPSLTRAEDYATPDPPQGSYSPQMESAASYFDSDEGVIESFDDLNRAITQLIGKTPKLPLVWRGVRDADWGLHSYLYRRLMETNGVVAPREGPTGDQPYPDEDQMVLAEQEILRVARSDWRFDEMSALETFARIQHAGGPTRLIDVTKNPYIGAWFAVEMDPETDEKDARLFALATQPVSREGKPPPPDSTIQLDEVGGRRDPFWHALIGPADRQQVDWGTGARRRIWVPPAYDPRISAQNAAFILDGVPITSARTASYFTVEHNVYWRRADLLAAASIYLKMHKPTQKPKYTARNFAPTFSFRITREAKSEIREVMESRFGYRTSYIYPDMAGLATHLKSHDLTGQ